MAHTLQERYSNLVLAKLRKESVILGLFNNRYEGTPKAGAVKIPVRDTEVSVGDYTKTTGGTLSYGSTAYKTLNIDKDKYVNELIDGYEATAVPDNLVADRLDSAGYSMAHEIDSELATLLKTTGTDVEASASISKNTVYEEIVDHVQGLKKLGIATNEMWLLVSNEAFGEILKAPEFIKASNLGDAVVQNGVVGRIGGVNVIETNNMADGVDYVLGNNVFAHFVDEWMTPVAINDLKDGVHIGASAVQGRRVYGSLLSRPTTILVRKTVGE